METIGAKMDFENIDEFMETVEQPTVLRLRVVFYQLSLGIKV